MSAPAAEIDEPGGRHAPAAARAQLILLLQLAYSGELAAAWAYVGHRASVKDAAERRDIGRILRDELRHRQAIAADLAKFGAAPDPRRERKMTVVGRSIMRFCLVGGWFWPMWGAGRLEAQNIREYEHAARLAVLAGHPELVESFLEMAEVEWDHEAWFRAKAASHPLWRVVPHWPAPPPRTDIRAKFAEFLATDDRRVEPIRIPLLVR